MRFEPDPVAVGRDIDAHCSRCRLDLAHTIIAMVGTRVAQARCNTCGAVHRFKAPKSEPKQGGLTVRKRASDGTIVVAAEQKPPPRAPAPKRPAAPAAAPKERFDEWQRLVGSADDVDARYARAYSMRDAFEEGELIRHDKFGLGRVLRTEGEDRVVILFREGEKRLVAGRGPVSDPQAG
ncbi:MAG: hypothetical protein AMXMBFR64_21800 [Myxococcales bacterium]